MNDLRPTFEQVKEQCRSVAPQTGHSVTAIEKMAKQAAKGSPAPKDVSKAFGGHENLATAGQVINETCNFRNKNRTP